MADSFAAGALKSNGPSISLLDNSKISGSVGIGNFKGVMLCNRPFAGVTNEGNKLVEKGDKSSFSCGVVPNGIGSNVSMTSKEQHKIKRPKKESALTKHRKWLAELQATKDNLEAQYIGEMQAKQEAKEKFRDNEMKMRSATKTILNNKSTTKMEETAAPKASKNNRPAWADEKGSEGEEKEGGEYKVEDPSTNEEDSLLDFAMGLDYEKYMDDMEVCTMMDRVRRRIGDLERDLSQEEKREMDAASSPMVHKRQEMKKLKALIAGPEYDENDMDDENIQDMVNFAAKDVLKSDEEMSKVHSTKSVGALMSKVYNEPIIAINDPNDGTRIDGKNAISNLPYLHRNPAV